MLSEVSENYFGSWKGELDGLLYDNKQIIRPMSNPEQSRDLRIRELTPLVYVLKWYGRVLNLFKYFKYEMIKRILMSTFIRQFRRVRLDNKVYFELLVWEGGVTSNFVNLFEIKLFINEIWFEVLRKKKKRGTTLSIRVQISLYRYRNFSTFFVLKPRRVTNPYRSLLNGLTRSQRTGHILFS